MNNYSLENAAERQHLTALVNRLTDDQLKRPLEAGWTVAGVLAHLAFWDQRALLLLEKWKHAGVSPSANDVDIINDATRLLCVALAPRVAAQLAVSCAAAIDQAIESLEPGLLADVETKGTTVRLNRALHRSEHLKQIEQALGL